jgi:hypothetical protein
MSLPLHMRVSLLTSLLCLLKHRFQKFLPLYRIYIHLDQIGIAQCTVDYFLMGTVRFSSKSNYNADA